MLREKVLEHIFLGDLTRALLRAGRTCEVLRAEYDGSGYDLVLESGPLTRHVQLKAMRSDGKRAHVDINTGLAAKPSGCMELSIVSLRGVSEDPCPRSSSGVAPSLGRLQR